MDTVAVDLTGVRATALIELYAPGWTATSMPCCRVLDLDGTSEGNGPTER
jgi:hypothetical protein